MTGAYLVVGCPRCKARRVVEQGRKTATCPRCGATIELRHAPPLFSAPSIAEAQAFMGAEAADQSGASRAYAREVKPRAAPQGPRERERARIAEAVGGAQGRANQLKLILRRGFEAFGELTEEDLSAIARIAELEETGAGLASEAVELGLAGRTAKGTLVPLREGR